MYMFKNELGGQCITECKQNSLYSNSFTHQCLSCLDELDGGMCFNSALNRCKNSLYVNMSAQNNRICVLECKNYTDDPISGAHVCGCSGKMYNEACMFRCPDGTFTNDTADCFAECDALTYVKEYQDSTSEQYCVSACTDEVHMY